MLVETVTTVGRECGFELVGVAPAGPVTDFPRFERWLNQGHAGEMRYLTDHRANMRRDVRALLPNARSVICVGKLYNTPDPPPRPDEAHISRYAWGSDYHDVMRAALENMSARLLAQETFDYKICVDTAPVLERSLAREAGLGWIGKNTCLINESSGSWFFLGEIITSLDLTPSTPPPDRCGSCTRCIEACPTEALVPEGAGWTLDSRRCISYLTIELRGSIPEKHRSGIGNNLFGCDICQDVCPWNRRAPVTSDEAFQSSTVPIRSIAAMSPESFRERFRATPIARTKYAGLLRNAAVVMGNLGPDGYRDSLEDLRRSSDANICDHAQWALDRS